MQLHDIKLIVKGADSSVLFGMIEAHEDKLRGIGSLMLAAQGLELKAVAFGGITSIKIGVCSCCNGQVFL